MNYISWAWLSIPECIKQVGELNWYPIFIAVFNGNDNDNIHIEIYTGFSLCGFFTLYALKAIFENTIVYIFIHIAE